MSTWDMVFAIAKVLVRLGFLLVGLFSLLHIIDMLHRIEALLKNKK